jgi:hypothetical protein
MLSGVLQKTLQVFIVLRGHSRSNLAQAEAVTAHVKDTDVSDHDAYTCTGGNGGANIL